MKWNELRWRISRRLARHSLWEHLLGFWFSRHFTHHGILVVSGMRPFPRVINDGGTLRSGNCQFYAGVRLEIGRGAMLQIGNGTYINRNTVIVTQNHIKK
ncbi:MAG TPA: hypothetical protein VKA68_07090 [bacterium]|nr:hypothetical protein [bacterium]